jgi:23S rRNA (guanosine2251-2'-O)-methyltransferase
MSERLPYKASKAGEAYDGLQELPVSVLLDNVRSMYNVGSFFRTLDAAGCHKLYLCGITARPPQRAITKTALGSEETVAWEHHADPIVLAQDLRAASIQLVAIETTPHAVDLYDWQPRFPVCLLFGHEVDGLSPQLLEASDTQVRIPMLGRKHSLNVATAGGIVIYELLRKYRTL